MPRLRSASSFLLAGATLLPAKDKVPQEPPPPPPAAAAPIAPQPLLRLDEPPAARTGVADVAVRIGLEWLLKHQDRDGRWNSDAFMAHDGSKPTDGAGKGGYDVALTGLSLLALAREGPTSGQDPRRLALLRGASWLAKQQEANGRLGPAATHDFVYGHTMGTLGLLATAAATDDAASRDVARQAIGYLEQHRNPYGVWRYQPRDNDNDSSVTTWALCANLAAQELRLEVNAAAFSMVASWFQMVTDADGRAGYTRAGEASSRLVDTAQRFPPTAGEAMTAAALLCRTHLGQSVTDTPILAKSVALLLAKTPQWEPEHGTVDLCYWFFATEGLRAADAAAHTTWTTALVPVLTTHQRQDTTFAGSWDPIDPWGENGGRVYATALAVLALQATAPRPPAKK